MRRAVLLAAALSFAAPAALAGTETATRTSTAPITIDFAHAFVRASGDELAVESRAVDKPLFGEWWFWGIVGVVTTGIVVSGVILSSGGTFVPDGELGNSNTSDWNRF